MWKKILSMFLIICIITSLVPQVAFATESLGQINESVLQTDDELWTCENYEAGVVLTEYHGTATDVYVPSNVEIDEKKYDVIKLGDSLFENNDSLNSATLGAGIKEIGARAFYDADNMVCILTSEELATIGDEAFYSCDSFNSIILYDASLSLFNIASS